MERKWANDNLNGVAWKAAAIHDLDGSVSGVPNSYILLNDGPNDSIATDATACDIKPTWNAAVCKGDVGRLSFAAPRGPGLGIPGAGPGAAGPGPAPAAPGTGGRGPAGPGAVTAITVAPGARGAAAQPPIILTRNGREYSFNSGNVRAGTEMKLTTERPNVNLTLTEMDAGSWVIFELPGFTTAASGTAQTSLDALRKANTTSYFKDKDALWVKVVSNGDGARGPRGGGPGGGTSLQVSR